MMLIKLIFCLTVFTAVLSSSDDQERPDFSEKFQNVQITKLEFRNSQEKYSTKLQELSEKLLWATDAEQVAIVNEYVDAIIPELNVFIATKELDPVEIPGFEASFRWTIFSGWVLLEDGSLSGLATFVRTGDVKVKYEKPRLKISIPLGFSNLNFKYYYEVKFMHLGPTGDAQGTSKGNKFTIDLSLDLTTLRARLDKFNLRTLGTVTLKFSGNILTDWIVNLILGVVMPILKPILGLVIEGYIVDGVASLVDYYNNIVCNLLNDC